MVGVFPYVKNKDAKLSLGRIRSHLLPRRLNVLLQLLDRILQRRPRIVHLVDNQHPLADQVLHLAQRGEVEPLGPGHLGPGGLDLVAAERLVEGQADGLDGDVGRPGLLEERAEDAGGDVAAAADGDHELGLELGEELASRLLAQLVDLEK